MHRLGSVAQKIWPGAARGIAGAAMSEWKDEWEEEDGELKYESDDMEEVKIEDEGASSTPMSSRPSAKPQNAAGHADTWKSNALLYCDFCIRKVVS